MAQFAHARRRQLRAASALLFGVIAVAAGVLLSASPAAAFTPPQPWIKAIAPSHGAAAGGNEVVLTGENLQGLTNVAFGRTYARVLSSSATSATVVAPAGLSGTTVDVRLAYNTYYEEPTTTTLDDYTYDGRTRQPLTFTPTHGSPEGGTEVTITGTRENLRSPTSVTFGGKAAEILTSSDYSVTVKTPAGPAGDKVPVTLTTAAGDLEGTPWSRFAYDWTAAPPVITSVSPNAAAVDSSVVVRGSDFLGATSVTLGGEPVSFWVSGNDLLSVNIPARMPGKGDLVVTTPVGVSENTPDDDLTILPGSTAPIVASISPNHGTQVGGTEITIRGANLGTATRVAFGFQTGVDLRVISDEELRVTTPHFNSYEDKVDVTVERPDRETQAFPDVTFDDFAIDVTPGSVTLAPNHGPAASPTTVVFTAAEGLEVNRIWKVLLTQPGAPDIELQMSATGRNERKVTVPAGVPGRTGQLKLYTRGGTRLNRDGDTFLWDRPPGEFTYTATGTGAINTLIKGSFPARGAASLTFAPGGGVTGTLTVDDTTARLVSGGFLPLTAVFGFTPSGRLAGTFGEGGLRVAGKYRISVKKLKIFGAIPLVGGVSCQTKQLADFAFSGPGFDPEVGGALAATFAISDLNSCGGFTGLVSPLVAGGGNTLSLQLVPKA